MVAVGLASLGGSGRGLWQLTALVAGPFALLGAGSAVGTLLVARRAERALPGARANRALPDR